MAELPMQRDYETVQQNDGTAVGGIPCPRHSLLCLRCNSNTTPALINCDAELVISSLAASSEITSEHTDAVLRTERGDGHLKFVTMSVRTCREVCTARLIVRRDDRRDVVDVVIVMKRLKSSPRAEPIE